MDRSKIEEIKQKLDIVTVVQEYVPALKRSGRNYFAPCPFHNEKTPSFSVNEDIQRYKCFGCGESGDVIKFIEKMEGIDFRKAFEMSAEKAGVKIDKTNFKGDSKEYELKKKLYQVNLLTAEFFHHVLMKHPKGELGRNYANKRKFGKKEVKEFLIGFAPEGYENLKGYLKKKGYSEQDAANWSLLVQKNGKTYDKFRKRLMFPIHNHVGDVVGFSGRVVDNEDIPKYLNSSETPVYKKSDVVYGLFQAKNEIRRKKFVVIVEGNVDVPMAHKFGVKNIIAPMGTALTEGQLKLIHRYADSVYFAFDNDNAGEKALIRSYELTEKLGIESKAIDLGKYGDLDDLLQAEPEKIDKVIENAQPVVRNFITRLNRDLDLGKSSGKTEFVKKIIPVLSYVDDKVELSHYVQIIADSVEVDEKIIWDKLDKQEVKPASTNKTKNKKVDSEPVEDQDVEIDLGSIKEKYLVSFLIQYPEFRDIEVDWDIIKSDDLKRIYNKLTETDDVQATISSFQLKDREIATELVMQQIGEFESDNEARRFLEELIQEINEEYLKRKVKQIKIEMRKKEGLGEDISELLAELNAVSQRLR